MNPWLIIKTDLKSFKVSDGSRIHREFLVEAEVKAMGMMASVPKLIVFYRTKEDRANGTRSRKETPAIRGMVFLQSDYAVPVAHIEGVRGYMQSRDYEYAFVSDMAFTAFRSTIEGIYRETLESDALKAALMAKKARKEALKFHDGLERLKSRMESKLNEAA